MPRKLMYAGCVASLAIGLFFVFVWAPHPWGWTGFDGYQDFGAALARGEAFPTVDQPWGYAYFLAFFYRLFGVRPVVPLSAQVALNATLPWLVYRFARSEFDARVAGAAALLTGVCGFNTVYASTQSSDCVCTVVFTAAVLLFALARRRGDDAKLYAASGVLLGTAPQFRPNLILVPLLLGMFLVVERRTAARAANAGLLIAASLAMLTPWIARNTRLTGEPLPTSTHGGQQLWYGTLQTGRYLASRAYNPRSAFETGSFPYTSLDRVPLVVTGRVDSCVEKADPTLVYWTDREATRRRVPIHLRQDGGFETEMPAQPAPTAVYFYLDGTAAREAAPHVYFVSGDHLGDLDRHDDLLDVFDVVRLLRHAAWGEPVRAADRLDFDGNRRLDAADARLAADTLLAHADPPLRSGTTARVDVTQTAVALRFADGSAVSVPRAWSGRVTDLDVEGGAASAVLHTWVSFADVSGSDGTLAGDGGACAGSQAVGVNDVYYRAQPHAMRRYFALALDNIRRDPAAFAASAAFRAVRVFFVAPSDDPHTNYQFAGSRRIYRAAAVASIAFLALFAAGIVAARRRRASIALPLALIAYIPATLGFVLTNMRYSITVQPLMFVFVAAALVSALEGVGRARRPAGTRTVRQP
jgi:hypothetical protein